MDPHQIHDAAELVATLTRAGQSVAVAESCTGGLLGGALTAAPGASEVFWGGVISYDDRAKQGLLGVQTETIERHGAVSREVALEMATGVRRCASATWGVSVTGIAGPDGGTADKPVGLVWIAVEGPSPAVRRYQFIGDRAAVRAASVTAAMSLLSSCVSGDATQDVDDE
ncbi:MAG: CinA family protein [Gemmatimonadota bacterium]